MKLLHLIIAVPLTIFGATFLFWAGIAFEHRPAGWPNYAVHAHLGPLPINWTFRLPDSPAAQLAALRAQEKAAGAHAVRVVQVQTRIVERAAAAETKAQAQIRWRTQYLTQEIPAHVPPAVDRDFRLPVGLLREHDAAVRAVDVSAIPLPAGKSDVDASDVRPSDAAAVLVHNAGVCLGWAEQLSALQAVILKMQTAAAAP